MTAQTAAPYTALETIAWQGIDAAMRLAHETATNAGWYRDPRTGQPIDRNFGEVVALMHSELSEALEAHRKRLMDDKLPHRNGMEAEFADVNLRIFDTAAACGHRLGGALLAVNSLLRQFSLEEARFALAVFHTLAASKAMGFDLAGALIEKNRFNRTREDHKLEARAAGGKRY